MLAHERGRLWLLGIRHMIMLSGWLSTGGDGAAEGDRAGKGKGGDLMSRLRVFFGSAFLSAVQLYAAQSTAWIVICTVNPDEVNA